MYMYCRIIMVHSQALALFLTLDFRAGIEEREREAYKYMYTCIYSWKISTLCTCTL